MILVATKLFNWRYSILQRTGVKVMSVTSKIRNNVYEDIMQTVNNATRLILAENALGNKEIIIKEKQINDEMSDLLLKMPVDYNKKVNEDRCKDTVFNVNDYLAPVFPTLSTPEPIDFATKVGELKPVKPMCDRYLLKNKLTNRYYKIRNKIKNCIFRKTIALRHYIKTIKFVWE